MTQIFFRCPTRTNDIIILATEPKKCRSCCWLDQEASSPLKSKIWMTYKWLAPRANWIQSRQVDDRHSQPKVEWNRPSAMDWLTAGTSLLWAELNGKGICLNASKQENQETKPVSRRNLKLAEIVQVARRTFRFNSNRIRSAGSFSATQLHGYALAPSWTLPT